VLASIRGDYGWIRPITKNYDYFEVLTTMKQLFAVISGMALALMLSAGASAATISKTVTFENPSQVGSTTLQPGDYKVTYDNSSQSPQVNFMKGKKTLATVPAQIKDLGSKTNSTSLVWNTQGSTPVLQEIHFGGSNQAVVLSENGSGSASGR
jgi:hypothetical protein